LGLVGVFIFICIVSFLIGIYTDEYTFATDQFRLPPKNTIKIIVDLSFPMIREIIRNDIPDGTYVSQDGLRMSMCPAEAEKLLLTQGGIYVSPDGIVKVTVQNEKGGIKNG